MTLLATDDRKADQIAYWNGPVGDRWRARQEGQDSLLAPILEGLLQRAAPSPGEVVIDIGCGCGTSSIELARHVMPGGRVVGVDISAPMLQWAGGNPRSGPS
jgi:SAM-dependent methyltransferase